MSSFTLAWHFLIFGVLPYVVIAVLVLGSLARFVLAPYSWKSQSSEILDKKDIFWGANLFHIGVIFLFCGHCFGLFTPTEWLNAAGLTPRLHQMMEIICGGLSAIVAITGLIILTWRRLTNERVRAASRPSDFWVLFLLLTVIILGIGCVVNSYFYDRSGATIIGGILLGTSRKLAAEYTFFLAIPTMLGASLLKLVNFGLGFTGTEIIILLLGMAVAFVVSILAIKFLMGYIKKHDFKVFGWYRIILGILVLGYFVGKTFLA